MRGGNFVVVDWILIKCENVGLHKMIGAGSRGGKLAIRANPLVRQSLAQSAASVVPCQPTVVVERGP